MNSKIRTKETKCFLIRFLNKIEQIGNTLPGEATILFILWFIIIGISFFISKLGISVVHPGTGKTIEVVNLLSEEQIRLFLTNIINNFITFKPLGLVLITIMGIGIAEKVGIIEVILKVFTKKIPIKFVTALVIFLGIMSNLIGDAGYIIYPPIVALVFLGIGRHPLVGLFAAYAGVSIGFSANVSLSMLDILIAEATISAAQIIKSNYISNSAMNYYFLAISCFMLTVSGTFATEKYIAPRFEKEENKNIYYNENSIMTDKEKKSLKYAGMSVIALLALIILLCIGGYTLFKNTQVSLLTIAPTLIKSIILLITLLFFIPVLVYGMTSGKIKSGKDLGNILYDSISKVGPYIMLAFIAGQLIALFKSSNISSVLVIKGAQYLVKLGITGLPLIVTFIILTAFLNLFVGSAVEKWAIMAPIFVPMFMLLGYSPALTQIAYRIGDSITNPISPIFTYFPIILGFARKYDSNIGMGTIMSSMIPYSIAFGLSWMTMLVIFILLGLPLGPGAGVYYTL